MLSNTNFAPNSLQTQLLNESLAMARYIFSSGRVNNEAKALSAETIQQLDKILRDMQLADPSADDLNIQIPHLVAIHSKLAGMVSPATPGTLAMLDKSARQSWVSRIRLGRISLVGQMLFISVLCLAAFLALTILKDVGIMPELYVPLYYLAAAGTGASITAMRRMNKYIEQRTIEGVYNSSYWIRFILGLMAGPVLSLVFPLNMGTETVRLSPVLIALCGGFASDILFTALTRITTALERMVMGSAATQQKKTAKAATAVVQQPI